MDSEHVCKLVHMDAGCFVLSAVPASALDKRNVEFSSVNISCNCAPGGGIESVESYELVVVEFILSERKPPAVPGLFSGCRQIYDIRDQK